LRKKAIKQVAQIGSRNEISFKFARNAALSLGHMPAQRAQSSSLTKSGIEKQSFMGSLGSKFVFKVSAEEAGSGDPKFESTIDC